MVFNMDFDVFDMLGKEIEVYSTVVGSFNWGSSSTTRIGEVLEKKIVHPKSYGGIAAPPNYYLKIRWLQGRGLPDKPSLIGVKPGEKSHLLKVEIDGIK